MKTAALIAILFASAKATLVEVQQSVIVNEHFCDENIKYQQCSSEFKLDAFTLQYNVTWKDLPSTKFETSIKITPKQEDGDRWLARIEFAENMSLELNEELNNRADLDYNRREKSALLSIPSRDVIVAGYYGRPLRSIINDAVYRITIFHKQNIYRFHLTGDEWSNYRCHQMVSYVNISEDGRVRKGQIKNVEKQSGQDKCIPRPTSPRTECSATMTSSTRTLTPSTSVCSSTTVQTYQSSSTKIPTSCATSSTLETTSSTMTPSSTRTTTSSTTTTVSSSTTLTPSTTSSTTMIPSTTMTPSTTSSTTIAPSTTLSATMTPSTTTTSSSTMIPSTTSTTTMTPSTSSTTTMAPSTSSTTTMAPSTTSTMTTLVTSTVFTTPTATLTTTEEDTETAGPPTVTFTFPTFPTATSTEEAEPTLTTPTITRRNRFFDDPLATIVPVGEPAYNPTTTTSAAPTTASVYTSVTTTASVYTFNTDSMQQATLAPQMEADSVRNSAAKPINSSLSTMLIPVLLSLLLLL